MPSSRLSARRKDELREIRGGTISSEVAAEKSRRASPKAVTYDASITGALNARQLKLGFHFGEPIQLESRGLRYNREAVGFFDRTSVPVHFSVQVDLTLVSPCEAKEIAASFIPSSKCVSKKLLPRLQSSTKSTS